MRQAWHQVYISGVRIRRGELVKLEPDQPVNQSMCVTVLKKAKIRVSLVMFEMSTLVRPIRLCFSERKGIR